MPDALPAACCNRLKTLPLLATRRTGHGRLGRGLRLFRPPGGGIKLNGGRLPAAPPDLLDDDAVVAVALAVADTGAQNVGVDLRQRQALTGAPSLFEHQL